MMELLKFSYLNLNNCNQVSGIYETVLLDRGLRCDPFAKESPDLHLQNLNYVKILKLTYSKFGYCEIVQRSNFYLLIVFDIFL